MSSSLNTTLNNSWKTTVRVLLGEDVGPLEDYEGYLAEYLPKPAVRSSYLSGKKVSLATDSYNPEARFISADELGRETAEPLSINDMKDIDSLAEALKERWTYCGNRILGNSALVESSDLVTDSNLVQKSSDIQQSSHVFSSFMVRSGSRNIFGSGYFSRSEFIIRSFGAVKIARCLEAHFIADSSDIYFSHNCFGCSELMFSFFQRGKRHCIGNLQLPKDKYLELKKRLLSEIAVELKAKKRFPSLFELAGARPPKGALACDAAPRVESMERIERAFSSTFKKLFRREPGSITAYENWLSRHSSTIKEAVSPFGHKVSIPSHLEFAALSLVPSERWVSLEESFELGDLKMDVKDISSLDKVIEALPGIAYFTPEVREGQCSNNIRSPLVYNASDTYKVYDATNAAYAGVSSQALDSKYIFGGNRIIESEFCVNCYNSLGLARCFEMDSSTKCSDSFFCHNSEGLQDSMFCYNLKGKRHAIGNSVLGPGSYAPIRASLLEQLADGILAKKSCRLDIFAMGGRNG